MARGDSLRASSPGRSGGRAGKGGEFATLWNLKICIEKLDAKCCLAEMTLVMTSLPLRRALTCFSMLVYIRARLVMRIEDMITKDEFA